MKRILLGLIVGLTLATVYQGSCSASIRDNKVSFSATSRKSRGFGKAPRRYLKQLRLKIRKFPLIDCQRYPSFCKVS